MSGHKHRIIQRLWTVARHHQSQADEWLSTYCVSVTYNTQMVVGTRYPNWRMLLTCRGNIASHGMLGCIQYMTWRRNSRCRSEEFPSSYSEHTAHWLNVRKHTVQWTTDYWLQTMHQTINKSRSSDNTIETLTKTCWLLASKKVWKGHTGLEQWWYCTSMRQLAKVHLKSGCCVCVHQCKYPRQYFLMLGT